LEGVFSLKKFKVKLFVSLFTSIYLISIFITGTVYGYSHKQDNIIINPIQSIDDDFIKGVDISTLLEVEENGGVFYNEKGKEEDCLKILKDNGVNYVRLRLWNNPVFTEDQLDEDGNVEYYAGEYMGGGNNDLETTLLLAKRAKKLNMKIYLDFHYSDWWADPGKQNIPAEWEDLSVDELKIKVYEYTKEVLEIMDENGVLPDMVQIGNEVNGGILWPYGKTWYEEDDTEIGGYDGFVELLSQGINATREVCGEDTKVVIHVANGGNNDLFVYVFDELTERNLDFDVIGISYYPIWHGTLDDLKYNMEDLSERYGKELAVVETGYANTLEDDDGWENFFVESSVDTGGYKATVQGQASAIRDIMEVVSDTEGGLGIFYWEPAWISGVGWKVGEGNPWENMTFFDYDGKVLPSIKVFNVSNKGRYTRIKISEVEKEEITLNVGEEIDLPSEAKVYYNDDSLDYANVTWKKFNQNILEKEGAYTIKGCVEGTNIKAYLKIIVVE
jgi:arabinogalactan endo-1,4-beta-galactosidase